MLRYLINNLIITNALRIYYITHCITLMIEKRRDKLVITVILE